MQYGVLSGAGSDGNPLAAAGADPPSPAGSAWACTKYTGISDPDATLTDSLAGAFASASATGPDGGAASAGVLDTVSYSPVSLQLVGPTLDGSGGQAILIGQGCTASVVGLPTFPSGYTVSYQWTVPGRTFSSWTGGVGQQSATITPGISTDDVHGTAHWYWADNAATEVITCEITVTPPSGQGTSFTVAALQQVALLVPTIIRADGTGGDMLINTNGPGNVLTLYAGPTADQAAQGFTQGMNWRAGVTTPPLFAPGTCIISQIVQQAVSRTPIGSTQPKLSDHYGHTGLDNSYGSVIFPANGFVAPGGDSPATPPLDDNFQEYSIDRWHPSEGTARRAPTFPRWRRVG